MMIHIWQLSLELTTKLLSQCSDDTAQRTRLIKLLTQIRTDLNRRKMCMLQGRFILQIVKFCSILFNHQKMLFPLFEYLFARREYDNSVVHCTALQRSTNSSTICGGRIEK